MLQAGQNWELFGYDVRQLGRHWRAAWRALLWGDDSPVKARLDERVAVHGAGNTCHYHAGVRVAEEGTPACEAVLLPESLVLHKSLNLPLAAEADLGSVMSLEIAAHSPFPPQDTASGWKVAGRGEGRLRVLLALAPLSGTMSYLGREYGCHDPHRYEVWTEIEGAVIALQGFGEGLRRQRYRGRLIRVGVLLGGAALLLLLIFGLGAGARFLELQQVRERYAGIERRAERASQLRSALAAASETIGATGTYLERYPDPHRELGRLSRLLDDDAFVQQLTIEGREIRLRGQAVNAAQVMAQLTAEPAYAEVTAPGPITKLGNTGMERFVLNISLADESR
jgi:general secretion pathway protein L